MENNLPKYITLTENNIDKDHICCAFSDKKCLAGYELKKRVANERNLPMAMFSGGLMHEPKFL